MSDDQIEIPSKENRPLVTFALFAYNQEKYIREAVEGAFAQTYEPLEIILSDDCSTDRTFEIMKEMVESYSGGAGVVARQTKKNVGTLLHVAEVAKLAHGKLLVLAAGDDVSLPERAETILNAWRLTGAWGFCSRFNRIDETGQITARDQTVSILTSPNYPLRQYFATGQNEVKIIHGATSAYDMRLFNFLSTNPEDYVLSEDGALSVLLNLIGKEIRILDSSLVNYRENEQSLTNAGKLGKISYQKIRADEIAIERFAHSQAKRCELFLRFQKKFGSTSFFQLDQIRLKDELKKQRMRARWRKLSFIDQVSYLHSCGDLGLYKVYFLRLLPEPIFFSMKIIWKLIVRKLKDFLKS